MLMTIDNIAIRLDVTGMLSYFYYSSY